MTCVIKFNVSSSTPFVALTNGIGAERDRTSSRNTGRATCDGTTKSSPSLCWVMSTNDRVATRDGGSEMPGRKTGFSCFPLMASTTSRS
jgi:hypothetical protein